jgi:3-oxoadipate enol-lactonase
MASEAWETSKLLGHELVGAGPRHVVVTNDWLCDTSTWDEARRLLDGSRLTFVFADLRGYGKSRGRLGSFTLDEAASDVLALTDALGWAKFSIVGHSMSALVALHLAQQRPARVERVVLLAPPPPGGFGVDEATLEGMRGLALADDEGRLRALEERFGQRLSPGWTRYKLARWRASADPRAVAGYAAMFARDGLPEPTRRVRAPVLAITGERDILPMRAEGVRRALEPLCARLTVEPLADSGHYPMQEMPPLTVALVERFLVEELAPAQVAERPPSTGSSTPVT